MTRTRLFFLGTLFTCALGFQASNLAAQSNTADETAFRRGYEAPRFEMGMNGADVIVDPREFYGVLRKAGHTDDIVDLLERQAYYRNGIPTRH